MTPGEAAKKAAEDIAQNYVYSNFTPKPDGTGGWHGVLARRGATARIQQAIDESTTGWQRQVCEQGEVIAANEAAISELARAVNTAKVKLATVRDETLREAVAYGGAFENVIRGALMSCMNEHGPITRQYLASATKRVIGQLRSLIGQHEERKPASEDEGDFPPMNPPAGRGGL